MPQLIVPLIVDAFAVSVATATTIATALVNIAVSIALSALSMLFAPRPNLDNQKQQQLVRQAVAPRRRAYGLVKLGGVFAFFKSSNSFLYQVIMLCQGEIGAFVQHWFGDDLLSIGEDGDVTAPPRFHNRGYHYGSLFTRTGQATSSVYDDLASAFPESVDENFRLDGIATTYFRLLSPPPEQFTEVYPAGLQTYNAVLQASKVWDPRDEAQSADDPTTWAYTDNGVLIVLDYLWHADGMRLPLTMLQAGIDVWKAEADLADLPIDLKAGGTEPQWRLGGTYELTDPPKTVLPLMLTPMDARLTLRGDGAVIIDTGKYTEPTFTLDDSCIYSYTLQRGKASADVRNEIRGTFVSSDYNFVQQEADPWRNEDSIYVDGLQSMTLNLDWSPSHSQARRRMKIEAYRQNPDWSGDVVVNAMGLKSIGQRYCKLSIAELAIEELGFEIQKWSLDTLSGRVTLSVISMPAEAFAWDPETDEGTAPVADNATADNGIEDVEDLEASASSVGAIDILNADWTGPSSGSLSAQATYRTHDDLVSDDDAIWHAMSVSGNSASVVALIDGPWDVRARFTNGVLYGDYSYVRSITA